MTIFGDKMAVFAKSRECAKENASVNFSLPVSFIFL